MRLILLVNFKEELHVLFLRKELQYSLKMNFSSYLVAYLYFTNVILQQLMS